MIVVLAVAGFYATLLFAAAAPTWRERVAALWQEVQTKRAAGDTFGAALAEAELDRALDEGADELGAGATQPEAA